MSKYLKFLLICFLFIPIFTFNFLIYSEQQFVYLAHAFLKGSFSLIQLPPIIADLSFFNDKYYWPLGPFPAIMLSPFVFLFNTQFLQGYIQFLLTVLNFWLITKICERLNLQKEKALWLAIFYIFGSAYTPIAIIPFSWYFAHVVATTCILLAIYEFLVYKRWFLIGSLIALATLTRINLLLSLVFFAPSLLGKQINFRNIFGITLPIAFALILIGFYNYQRFGDIFESGYSYQIIPEESKARRDFGLVSAKHIPANLYYMLIKTPDPVLVDNSHVLKPPYLKFDPYGMSLFFMSPILFLLFRAKLADPYVKRSLITIFGLLIPIITYYGIGYIQIGYRYALDFFPFLLLILISSAKITKITYIKILVIAGIIISWGFTLQKIYIF